MVAILAEYDALPELGHACGHNIIAASAVGGAVAARPAVDRLGGSVLVIGTPAEELSGGKIIMASRGAFEGLDAAMMVHPGTHDVATITALACQNLKIEFYGRAAHAAAQPEAGINALEAMVLAFNALNSLRQHVPERTRMHGIITAGGEAPNIVPAYSVARFTIRAASGAALEALKPRVVECFAGAARATGAELKYHWDEVQYGAMRNNLTLARLFMDNMAAAGREYVLSDPAEGFGSTDMGNVSQLLPAIHPVVAIAPPGVAAHSPEFAAAAASEAGQQAVADAAQALALTVADFLARTETRAAAATEFCEGKE
jgi:amidohydrolase